MFHHNVKCSRTVPSLHYVPIHVKKNNPYINIAYTIGQLLLLLYSTSNNNDSNKNDNIYPPHNHNHVIPNTDFFSIYFTSTPILEIKHPQSLSYLLVHISLIDFRQRLSWCMTRVWFCYSFFAYLTR